MRLTTLLLLCLGLATTAWSSETIDFTEIKTEGDWDAVMKKAQKENKAIFLDMYADWCGYCKKMVREIYPQEEVADYYNAKFINVRVDGEKGVGEYFSDNYEVEGFPTHLYFDGLGNLLNNSTGYLEADEFMEIGTASVGVVEMLPVLAEKYKSGKLNAEETADYASILQGQGNIVKAEKVVATYLKGLGKEAFNYHYTSWELINQYGLTVDGEVYELAVKNRDNLKLVRGTYAWDEYLTEVISVSLIEAIEKESEAMMKNTLDKTIPILKETDEENEAEKIDFVSRVLFYEHTGNYDQYNAIFTEYIKANGKKEMDFITEQLAEIVQEENPNLTPYMVGWTKAALDIEENVMNATLYLYALLLNDECKDALKYAKYMEGKYEEASGFSDEVKNICE